MSNIPADTKCQSSKEFQTENVKKEKKGRNRHLYLKVFWWLKSEPNVVFFCGKFKRFKVGNMCTFRIQLASSSVDFLWHSKSHFMKLYDIGLIWYLVLFLMSWNKNVYNKNMNRANFTLDPKRHISGGKTGGKFKAFSNQFTTKISINKDILIKMYKIFRKSCIDLDALNWKWCGVE